MNADNSAEEALFDAARRLTDPAARAAFLDAACAGNPALRERLERLLRTASEADDFFDRNAVDLNRLPPLSADLPTLITPPSEQPGERIGHYKLLQEIGEGGFGTVWMAEQSEPISRMVALKVIKAGMDTKQVLARFEAERQALAMMEHPNIAKVLDAGATATGRPWFAMELVKGIPITRFCDEAGMGTRERLALFDDVCSAINHAHQKGVIHRDIKPSNVMITLYGDRPVVKVIDFGIAKATQGKLTDMTLFTRFEQFIGTPVYMSPEQASLSGLDIDTRSDIYALGILLYELLVGKPPFDGKSLLSAGYEEMRRIIREVEPVKPSSRLSTLAGEERTLLAKARHVEEAKLNKLVEPDLDWIVMKAIEKDRSRRYETANAFAQDIARFLADEAVTARPPSAGYQFRKFARRNRAALRVAAAIAAVLVAATAVSTWQAIRATRAEEQTARTLERVAAERDAKEAALGDAEATSKFLTDMFDRSKPGERKGGREVKVVDVLDPAAAALEADEAIPPSRRAKLQDTLGATYYALGLTQQAIALQEKVRDYYLATLGPEHHNTLALMSNLARSYYIIGRREEALEMGEKALTLRRQVDGPEHRDTLIAMTNLAVSYFDAGRRDEALKMREKVLTLSRQSLGPEHRDTLMAMSNLAASYQVAGRPDETLKLSEEVLELSRKVHGPEHPDTLKAINNHALSFADVGRRGEALKMQEEALPLSRKVLGPEHPDTLTAMQNLAGSYYATGRIEEALKLCEEELPLSRKALGPEHPDTLMAMNNLAISYSLAGRMEEALKLCEEALPINRKVLGPEHPGTLWAMTNLASSYSGTGRKDEALKMREEVLALSRKVNGPEHPGTLGAMTNLAASCDEVGRLPEAVALQEEALVMKRRVLPPNHPFFAIALNQMAELYEKTGRTGEAAKLRAELAGLPGAGAQTARPMPAAAPAATVPVGKSLTALEAILDTVRKEKGLEAKETIAAMTALAVAYGADGSGSKAIKLGEEALALARGALPAGDPHTVAAMNALIPLYIAVDLTEDAAQLEAELKALLAPVSAPARQ